MLFKCRNVGFKLIAVVYKTTNQKLSSTQSLLMQANLNDFQRRHLCSPLTEDINLDYDLITNGDKELEHKLKVLELEQEVMRQEGLLVPPKSSISTERWKELLALRSRQARVRLYEFLFKLSKKKENEKLKKIEKSRKRTEELGEKTEGLVELPFEEFVQNHNLGYNNFLIRVYDTTINQLYNNKLIQSIRFGEKLIVDCGYEQYMTKRENINCAKQLTLLFSDNRINDDPFDIHLCNVNKEGQCMKFLQKFIPPMYEPWFPLNIHEKSYLDVFPKEQLVYLTPHCREEMKKYDYDAIYIIGGLVDKSNSEPLSLAKAKKEGIRMAKLPLDRYLQWGSGGRKSLTINQMTSILLDVKNTRNWQHALRHVPRRKLMNNDSFENITNASNALPYDRPETSKKWVPSNGVDFENLRYAKNQSHNNIKRRKNMRIHNLNRIFHD